MKCAAIRNLMLRKMDHELSESEDRILELHLTGCNECIREYELLSLPLRIAQALTPLEPSPYFYKKLMAHIESEAQKIAILQQYFGLARKIIPSLAAITLALVSVFAYLQFHDPQDELYTAYEQVIKGEDLHPGMAVADQNNITDASILRAIANQKAQRNSNYIIK